MKLFKKFLPIVFILCLVFSQAAFAASVGDTIAKDKLSGSTDGKLIEITGTNSAGAVVIHTAVSGTTNFDEIYIWVINSHTAAVTVSTEWGVHADADDLITITVQPDAGAIMIIPGWVLQNGMTVEIFASVANVVFAGGYINELTE